MLRFGFLVAFAGLLTLAEHKDLVRGAEPAPTIVGKWQAPARGAGKGDTTVQTLEFRDGRMVWAHPRQIGLKSERRSIRIEAEYTLSKTGRVYGCVTLAGGETKADEGDAFSFMPRVEKGTLRMEDVRGNALAEEMLERAEWKPAP